MKNYSLSLKKTISTSRKSIHYRKYLISRREILNMINRTENRNLASKYWKEELAGFEYMFDASPLIINKLRHHTYHLTGLHDYNYRKHHNHSLVKFQKKFNYLKQKDKSNLFIGESQKLGGFGFRIDGYLINLDTLKFYEALIIMDHSGLLDTFRNGQSKTILEIGAGWGGFAYQFKSLFKDVNYIIVDLPGSLLFSATYLLTLFPSANYKFITNHNDLIKLSTNTYDFIFIPYYLWHDLKFTPPDLIVNMVSFQEMTSSQVEGYIKKSSSWGVKKIYSLNRDRSPNNTQLATVSSILKKYFHIKNIGLFKLQYLQLNYPTKFSQLINLATKLTRKKSNLGIYNYQHLLAEKI